MKVGINLLYLIPGNVGGTETYASGLLFGLAEIATKEEFIVFVNRECRTWPLPRASNFTRVVCPVNAVNRVTRYGYEQCLLPRAVKEFRTDLLHSLGYVAPLYLRCPSILTIPDLNYQRYGKQMSVLKRNTLAFFVRQSALRAQRVIAISEYARAEIMQAFSLPEERVAVTHLASKACMHPARSRGESDRWLDELGIRMPYLVAFSSVTANKNIPRLLQAFRHARHQYRVPHRLVLVGRQPGNDVMRYAEGLEENAIRFTGYLSEERLQAVLAGAAVMVFPSVYEGFGLPVLEAMAAGVPVVCSSAGAIREIAGDAAVFFDPLSVEDLAQKMADVALSSDLQDSLKQRGFTNAKRYSWLRTAEATLKIYHAATSGIVA